MGFVLLKFLFYSAIFFDHDATKSGKVGFVQVMHFVNYFNVSFDSATMAIQFPNC